MYRANEHGFVVLIATLVAGIVLVLTVGILSLSTREFKLSSLTKRSSVAYYNARSGVECAIYHDIKNGTFKDPAITEDPDDNNFIPSSISCLEGSHLVSKTLDGCSETAGVRSCTYVFSINNPPIDVSITKNISGSYRWTTIESRGKSGLLFGFNRTERIANFIYGTPP